jgi:uncharacterized protein (DUF302 family)
MATTSYDRPYAFTRQIADAGFAEVTSRTRAALATQGFGVLTEIDVRATLKQKLDVDRRPYLILGACNPPLAHRALEAEPPVGLFLPCNVTVFEGDDGKVYVQAIRPAAMFALIDNPAMEAIAAEVDDRLGRVMASI